MRLSRDNIIIFEWSLVKRDQITFKRTSNTRVLPQSYFHTNVQYCKLAFSRINFVFLALALLKLI